MAGFVAFVLAASVAAGVDESAFRYERELAARRAGPVLFVADGPLLAHARPGFADLRILDARGAEVPWRRPPESQRADVPVEVLNSGRGPGGTFALLDLGARRRVVDRIELELAGSNFLGRVSVSGSFARGGPFVPLGATPVFDVAGAEAHARSTTVVFPPSGFRYYRVAGSGVPAIVGATVSGRPRTQAPRRLRATVGTTELADRTRVVLDVRFARRPVDEVLIEATTAGYDREVLVEASNRGGGWSTVGFGRIVHQPGALDAPLPVDARARYIRVTIFNGDDTPLAGISAAAFARPRLLLAQGGRPRPYRLLYGNDELAAPRYDLSRLRVRAPVRGLLGPERRNAEFRPAGDDESLLDREPWLLPLALALGGIALATGALALVRRR